MRPQADILIVGGGLAGLTATARLASAGFSVICLEKNPPPSTNASIDLRTTAFLQPALRCLEAAGVWEGMAASAAPLRQMRIIDCGGSEPQPRYQADFYSHEAGLEEGQPFGMNVPNTAIRTALLNRISELPGAILHAPAAIDQWRARKGEVVARLSDGTRISARLLIAADGRNSFVRAGAGIGVLHHAYRQSAIVCSVAHEEPHENISTEFHRSGGPFTLVPMVGQRSAVVWMLPEREAEQHMALPDEAFTEVLEEKCQRLLGRFSEVSQRAVWPMHIMLARRMIALRLALIAEAAHVIPPIGAQGLNMSLGDIETLTGCLLAARERGEDIGAPGILRGYERAQLPRNMARVLGVHALNEAAAFEPQPLRDMRLLALRGIQEIEPLRRFSTRLGLG